MYLVCTTQLHLEIVLYVLTTVLGWSLGYQNVHVKWDTTGLLERRQTFLAHVINHIIGNMLGSVHMFHIEPPSSPRNLVFTVTSTTISLSWDQPLSLGGRNDLSYVISYQKEGTEDKVTRTVGGITNLTLTGLNRVLCTIPA